MMEIEISINGRPIHYARCLNTGHVCSEGHLYEYAVTDLEHENASDGVLTHRREDGAVALAIAALQEFDP